MGTPRNVLQFPKAVVRPAPKRVDCQGETGPYAVNLMDQIHRVKSGLDTGMSAAEIREIEAAQSWARIEHEARRFASYMSPGDAGERLRSLAQQLERKG